MFYKSLRLGLNIFFFMFVLNEILGLSNSVNRLNVDIICIHKVYVGIYIISKPLLCF